jgi:transposase InsO family protein
MDLDGLGAYPEAIRNAFGNYVNYAQIIKVYRAERPEHARYSPAACIGAERKWVQGFPNAERISTSHVERHNLTIRMGMRRFTRLTNGHSKKVENHGHALALFFAYYNFCRVHSSLNGQTPAMAAGLANRVFTLRDLIGLLD